MDRLTVEIVSLVAPRYDAMMAELFSHPIWQTGQTGPIAERRVLWTDAEKHRRSECFKKQGVYTWGIENRPLYIGKTGDSFNDRFGRYVWEKYSQCILARDHCTGASDPELRQLPDKLRELLEKDRRLRPRIKGAIRFAQEGIDKIWFALFPVTERRYIEAIEGVLIAAGNDWNVKHGLSPLLNDQGNSQ